MGWDVTGFICSEIGIVLVSCEGGNQASGSMHRMSSLSYQELLCFMEMIRYLVGILYHTMASAYIREQQQRTENSDMHS